MPLRLSSQGLARTTQLCGGIACVVVALEGQSAGHEESSDAEVDVGNSSIFIAHFQMSLPSYDGPLAILVAFSTLAADGFDYASHLKAVSTIHCIVQKSAHRAALPREYSVVLGDDGVGDGDGG
mmetsp:Transcript_172193/g.418722  ORF Transcript_172193/g.418722 Transcript_172193/m.418722 type:complete len:124 (-) Transcript_172193:1-372(-)